MPSNLLFDLKKSTIYDALAAERFFVFKYSSLYKKILSIFLFLTFFSSLWFYTLGKYTPIPASEKISSKLFGVFLFCLPLYFLFWILEEFVNYLKNPTPKIKIEEALAFPEKYNLAEFLDFESFKIINLASQLAQRAKRNLNSSILLYCFLKINKSLDSVFQRALLNKEAMLKILDAYLKTFKEEGAGFSLDFQNTILDALKLAKERGKNKITPKELLLALAKNNELFKRILIDAQLKIEDLEILIWWLEELEKEWQEKKEWWNLKNLRKMGSIGKEFAAGYTITLDKFSIDLTREIQKMGLPEIIGHKEEIQQVERILARREACNDPLIVGEAGSGRRSIVLAIARKSVLGESLPEINFKRIVQLNLPSLLSQIENMEEVEATLETIFKEVISAKNVILVIDEFHNYVGGGMRPGTIDISGILTPFIASPSFQLIAITTYEGLHRNIEMHPSLLNFFEKVEVSEVTPQETLKLLQRLTLKLENTYKLLISYQAIKDIIKYCEKYLATTPFPEKALDLLEEVVVHLAQRKEKIVLPKHVAEVVKQKTQIPVGEVETKEREILLNLEKLFHERVIDQEEAIIEISAALRRARAEVTVRKGPIGTFLFLGPTGVGKTETAKALAEIYFGSEKRMIRLDMSEFQNVTDIKRLLGSREEEGLLTTPVRENPFSLVLLDEFEKAHPQILNLFLQVFDEGHLTDGLGRKVDFKNTIIICTSNAGYQLIFKAARENREWTQVKKEVIDYLIENAMFRPELLNRFDAIVLYKPLTQENLLAISELLLKRIQKQLKEREIDFVITEELKSKIVALSYTPEFGARQMQRVIQDKVANVLAEAILRGELKRGIKISIDPNTFQIIKI
jgi:ATP-dependent Clp protease ATP-binding subunit ClpC